jgi:hypothetical protein
MIMLVDHTLVPFVYLVQQLGSLGVEISKDVYISFLVVSMIFLDHLSL